MTSSIVRRSLLFAAVSILLLGHRLAFSQEAVVKGPIVNVRSGPGTSFEIVGRVKKGDRFPIVKAKKNWIQINIDEETLEEIKLDKEADEPAHGDRETWIFRKLIEIVGIPPDFEERQIDFQNWALDEVPVTFIEFKSDWQIWVRLPPEKYASRAKVRQIARRIAQEYKNQTGFIGREIVVKVLKGNRVYATASE